MENPNLHSDIFAIIWLILIVALMIIGIGAYNKNKKTMLRKNIRIVGMRQRQLMNQLKRINVAGKNQDHGQHNGKRGELIWMRTFIHTFG